MKHKVSTFATAVATIFLSIALTSCSSTPSSGTDKDSSGSGSDSSGSGPAALSGVPISIDLTSVDGYTYIVTGTLPDLASNANVTFTYDVANSKPGKAQIVIPSRKTSSFSLNVANTTPGRNAQAIPGVYVVPLYAADSAVCTKLGIDPWPRTTYQEDDDHAIDTHPDKGELNNYCTGPRWKSTVNDPNTTAYNPSIDANSSENVWFAIEWLDQGYNTTSNPKNWDGNVNEDDAANIVASLNQPAGWTMYTEKGYNSKFWCTTGYWDGASRSGDKSCGYVWFSPGITPTYAQD